MPTPSKSIDNTTGHRTKAEKAMRKEMEQGLLTGAKLKEDPSVKDNPTAHETFLKTKKLLAAIGRDDALYSAQINRYAMLMAECADFEEKRAYFWNELKEFQQQKQVLIDAEQIKFTDGVKIEQGFQNSILAMDRQIQQKRKMLFDIEKENCMSIAASLRSIPKTPEKANNPLLEALRG